MTLHEKELDNPISEVIDPVQFERLLEISTLLSSTLNLQQLLQLVIQAATELTDTEVASILLLDSANNELYFAAASGVTLSEMITVPLEGSIAGWIVRHGKPLILDDVQTDDRHYSVIDDTTQYITRTMLGVPLVTKQQVIGALEVINKQEGVAYTKRDVALLQALASQAAVAIENARLFQQNDLVAEIMHELKTPLMALTAASELLQRDDLAKETQGSLVETIQQETNRLTRMTQQFLDLARLESGRVRMARKPFDLLAVVNETAQAQRPQALAKKITLECSLPATAPVLIGDRDRIKQALFNLVSNGIKYNQEEGGRLAIQVAPQGKEVQISVSNTGPGIAPENLEQIFARFYRQPDNAGFTEGDGLGLYITRKIIEEHGGRIYVESEQDEETTFHIILPYTLSPSPSPLGGEG